MSRTDLGIAVAATLAAAAAYGLASALQHDQAGRVATRGALDPGLLTTLARRPVWLLGIAADVVAVALQAVGLRFGPVVLVQPLLVAGLPVAVVLSALLARRRTTGRERLGLLLCTGGLALVVPATATVNLGYPTDARTWTVAAVLLLTAVGGLLLVGRRDARSAPLTTGVAAGITIGAGSVLLAVCAAHFDDPIRLLQLPAPYAALTVGLLGLLLSQAAFQTGSIAAPLAALSVTEPAVAVGLAVAVLHERLPGAAVAAAAGLTGAVLAVAGVLVLAAAGGGQPPTEQRVTRLPG